MNRLIGWLLALIISMVWMIWTFWPQDAVERNLALAGKNADQLRAVLRHYHSTGDVQKERLARFLIANMDRKGRIVYGIGGNVQKVEADLKTITADFLIENIDLAVEVWKKYPWCSQLSEEEFCRDLLPYRMRNEPLEDWRRFYYDKYKEVADSLARSGASIREVVFFFNDHYGKKYIREAGNLPGDLSYREVEQIGGGTCSHLALNAVQVLRSIGVPLNLDELPFHGKVNGGHAYNSFTDEAGRFIYFSPYEREPERNRWIAPVVNRISFEPPVYRRVTSLYFRTVDVTLPKAHLRLATFNRGRLNKLSEGESHDGQTCFRELSCGLLFFPVDEALRPSSVSPFILDSLGTVQVIPAPEKNKQVEIDSIHLYDVKRILPLHDGVYRLKGWDKGWVDLRRGIARDSFTLSFGKVPDYKLFLIVGDGSYIERMQRPFVLEKGKAVFY